MAVREQREYKKIEARRAGRKIKICEEEPLSVLVLSSVYPVRLAASRQKRD